MKKVRYEEMRVSEVEAARKEAPLVYVPIGSVEYHGLHLPMGLDAMHAYELCLQAAQQTGGVVLPVTFWGTRGHEKFPGSLLLKEETVAGLMQDILARLTEQGYRLIVVFTGHYPKVQGALLWRVAEEHMKANPAIRVMVLDPFDLHPTDPHGEHAGRLETSVMLYLKPELVDMEQLKQPGALRAITPDGAQATVEYGRERFTAILKELVTTVRKALCEP